MEAGAVEPQPLPRKLAGTEVGDTWPGFSGDLLASCQRPQWLTPARSQPALEDGTESGRDRWGVGWAEPG